MKRIRYLSMLWMLTASILAWAQEFNPDSPAEPGQLTRKLILKVSPKGAGYASSNNGTDILPGTSVTVNASPSSGWKFAYWTKEDGLQLEAGSSYTFTKADKTETLTAHFTFDPDAPSEPAELPFKLTLEGTEGGYVSGGGFYLAGTTVNISAYPSSGYEFEGWFNPDGTLYNENASTTYEMGEGPMTLTARFTFNPDSPAEPNEVNIWRLKLITKDGGTLSASTYYLRTGESTTIRAYANSGYEFDGWYKDGSKISTSAEYEYTMGEGNVTLEGRFEYMPENPAEPRQIQQRKFSFMLKNTVTKPGTTVDFPILLTPLATLGNMTFQLNFDPKLNVDFEHATVAATTTPYTVTREEVVEGDVAYDEGYTSYRFTLTGGSIEVEEGATPTVIPIMTFPFVIPDDIETGTAYRVTINQISMTNSDGTTQTAGTRNGLLSVYKLGDTNGDDSVDASDVLNIVSISLNKTTDVFIPEVSDINNDKNFDSSDVLGIVNISLNK